MKKELVERELNPLLDQANTIIINTKDDLVTATELLSKMNKVMDRVSEEKEKITRPALDIIAAERLRWKPLEDSYKRIIEPLREKMSVYQTQETNRQRKEEEAIAKKMSEGKISIEKGVAKIESIEKAEIKVITTSGSLNFREDKILKITNKKLIPDIYFIVDEKKLLDDLKAGKKINGAEIEIKMVPINRR